MKKIMNLFVLVAAVAMALSSCQKNEIENPANQNYEYTFLIGNADASDEVDSKAVVGENSVEWSTGDRMGVYTKVSAGTVSNNAYGDIAPGSPASMKVYSSQALSAGDYIYAYYPYDNANKNGSLEITMTIPAEQDGKDDMPMASLPYCVESALSSGQNDAPAGKIRFANLGAVIEFKIYTDEAGYASEKVRSVTFEADKAVAGSFTFDLEKVDYSDAATLQIASSELSENTIVASADDAAVGTSENPLLVRMVVAPGSYKGQVVVETDAALYTFPVKSAKEFPRSAVKPLGLRLRAEVRSEKPEAPADVWTLVTSVDNMPDGEYVIISEYNSCGEYAYLPSTTTVASAHPVYNTQKIFQPTHSVVMPDAVPTDMIWHISSNNDSPITWSIDNSEGKHFYGTNTNNGLFVGDTEEKWTISLHTDNKNALMLMNDIKRYVGIYNAENWRCYETLHENYKGSSELYFYYHGTITAKPGVAVSDVTGVSARGVENAELAYSLVNPDDNSVSAEPDGTVVTAASVQEGVIFYTVSPNKTASARDGRITITYGEVVKVVNVAQLAPVFTATQAEILLEADADANKSFTVTSDFGWNAVLSERAGFTISKESYEWAEGGKQSVTVTATAANTDEGIKNLGTVTFTSEAGAELVVTVKQETSYVAEGAATATLSFADKAQRTSFSASAQVWEQNGIKFTNNKASSTSSVADYANPVRCYASSSITIEMASQISEIKFTCNSSSHATALKNSITSGATVSVNGSEVSVILDTPNTSFTVAKLSAQVQIMSIAVTYSGSTSGGETPGEGEGGETTDPDQPGEGGGGSITQTLNVGTNGECEWTNAEKTASATVGDVKFTALGSGGNDSKYYNSDKTWRFYSKDTSGVKVSVPSGCKITQIVITVNKGVPSTPSGCTVSSESSVYTYSVSSSMTELSFYKSTDANMQIQTIVVTYTN